MANVPSDIYAGRIIARVVEFTADTPTGDSTPDMRGLSGTITIKPSVQYGKLPTASTPMTALAGTMVCPIINGVMYAPGTSVAQATAWEEANTVDAHEGVWAISTDQPNMAPSAFTYTASFFITGVNPRPSDIEFELPQDETVDLANILPAGTPPTGTIYVVTRDDYYAAIAARDDVAAALAAFPYAEDTTQAGYDAITPDADTYYFILPS